MTDLSLEQAGKLAAGGQLQRAASICESICKADEKNIAAWNLLGNIRAGMHDIGNAERCFRKVTALAPAHAQGYFALGSILQMKGDIDNAIVQYRRATELAPDHAEAHLNTGTCLYTLDDYHGAVTNIKKAIQLSPDMGKAHCALATVYQQLSKPEMALEHFQKALAVNPQNTNALIGASSILERQGKFNKAYTLISDLLENDRGAVNPHAATIFSLIARHVDQQQRAIELLERSLQETPLPDNLKMHTHFALGNLYDGEKKYDKAFTHYRSGNTLKQVEFNREGHSRLIDTFISTYSTQQFDKLAHSSQQTEQPVFVVGMPRSGTSLVEQILDSHPDVYGAGELLKLGRTSAEMPQTLNTIIPYPKCMAASTEAALDQQAADYLEAYPGAARDKLRVIDKMPHNFLHLGLIAQLFPRARIIHCIRDPLDTCLSCYFREFTGHHPYAYDLVSLGHYYQEYQRLMKHWKTVLPLPILDIHYEELVAEQEARSRELIDFIGLDWNPACVSFHSNQRIINTSSYDQVRRPIYRSSLQRWKHYDKHLAPLREALDNT